LSVVVVATRLPKVIATTTSLASKIELESSHENGLKIIVWTINTPE
jgi:hypothetical protein